jgi:multiple sugar transport system substrate-binding protein
VADLVEIGTGSLNQYHKNGVFQDLSAWAKAQKWWADMDPAAVKACTGPDGKLYCIPMAERPAVTYVWKDRWPNGFPKTPEEFLKEAERIKNDKSGAPKDKYGMTFFGSTDFDGNGAVRAMWTIISSFGGTYDDGKGKMLLNTPENIEAIKFIRTLVQNKYVPEIAFAGKFQEEEAFKDSSAGSFPTGLFGYRYVNPLTAPSGKKYEKKTQDDMLDAIAAGDVILAPMIAPAGKKPGCDINAPGLAIPVGAKNPEAAYDYINWLFTPEQNPDYVLGPGAGFPVLKSLRSDPKYQTPFYKQASAAVAASECKPWAGSIVDTAGAQKAVMAVVYKLIKQDPTADIAAELTKAQDAFNKAQ